MLIGAEDHSCKVFAPIGVKVQKTDFGRAFGENYLTFYCLILAVVVCCLFPIDCVACKKVTIKAERCNDKDEACKIFFNHKSSQYPIGHNNLWYWSHTKI